MCNDTGFGDSGTIHTIQKGRKGDKYQLYFRQMIDVTAEQAQIADRFLAERKYAEMEAWIEKNFPHDYQRVKGFFDRFEKLD